MVVAKTVEVKLQVSGGSAFRQEMLSGAAATREVGTAAIESDAKFGRLGNATKQLGYDTGGLKNNILGSTVGFIGAQAAIAAAMAGFSLLKTEVFGLDDALTKSTAIMGNVSGTMRNEMEASARSLSVEFNMSATTIAKGFFELASAGLTARQAIAAMPQVVAFAKAGMFDLSTAITLVTSAQSALGLQSSDAQTNLTNLTRVTDVLTQANNKAQGTLADFAEALSNRAAASGHAFGQSIEQVTAVLEAFAQTGVRGKVAGESYAILLRELTNKAGGFKKIGVDVFDANGQLRPFADIIDNITAKLGPMDAQQKAAAISTAHLSLQGRAMVLQLLGLGPAIRSYEADLYKAGGTTQDVAHKEMQSMIEKLGQLKQALVEAGRQGIDSLATFLAWLGDKFGPALQNIGQIVVSVASSFAPLGKGIALLGAAGAAGGLMGLASALEAVTGFLRENIGLVEFAVALYGVKLVGSLVGALAAFLDLQRVRLASMWLDATAGVEGFVTQLTFAEGAAGKLMAVLGAVGPVALFALAAGAALTLKNQLDDAGRAGEDMVKKLTVTPAPGSGIAGMLEADTKTIQQLSAAADELNRKIRQPLPQREAVGLANTIGGPVNSVLGHLGITGGGLPFGDNAASTKAEVDKLNKEIEDKKQLDQQTYDALSQVRLLALQPIKDSSGKNITLDILGGKSVDANNIDTQLANKAAQIKRIQEIAKQLNIGASDIQFDPKTGLAANDLTQKLVDMSGAAQNLSPAGQDAALAVAAIGDAAGVGSTQVDAMKKALDALFEVAFGSGRALDKVSGDLLSIADAAVKTAAGGGKLRVSFNENTKEGISFRESIRSTAEDIAGAGLEILKTGGSAEEAANSMKVLRQAFIDSLVKAGVAPSDILRTIEALDTATKNVFPIKVDAGKAKTDIAGVGTALDNVGRKNPTPTIGVNTDPAYAALDALNARLNTLASKSVIIAAGVNTNIPAFQHPGAHNADGNVYAAVNGASATVHRMRAGGEEHVAQIAPSNVVRVWAEPETGGEAYIPLAPAKRARSEHILATVADQFGMRLQHYADGGVAVPMPPSGSSSLPDPDPATIQFYRDQARQQIEILKAGFGGIGQGTNVQIVSDADMQRTYAGVTIYGSKDGHGDAVANGNPTGRVIQINAALLHSFHDPVTILHDVINKEFAQTVLPEFLNSDDRIKRYFDVIGYHPPLNMSAKDALNSGQVSMMGGTTPADLFGYFVSQSLGAKEYQVPPDMVQRLVGAGLIPIPNRAKSLLDMFYFFSAQSPGNALELVFQSILDAQVKVDKLKAEASRQELIRTAKLIDEGNRQTIWKSQPHLNTQGGQVVGAHGGGHQFFSQGGVRHEIHEAEIAPATRATRVWAEPETGGEAYVPLAPAKRERSERIVEHVANLFGYTMVPKADGGLVRFSDGGVMSYAAGGYNANPAIFDQASYENLVGYYAGTRQNTASFKAAEFVAAQTVPVPDLSGVTDANQRAQQMMQFTVDRAKAVHEALMQIAVTYTDVAKAAGQSAADQLAASGLVGKAFDDAAAKIVQEATERKQTLATLADQGYDTGKTGTGTYLHILADRLSHTKQYSAEWLSIQDRIHQVQQDYSDVQKSLEDEEFAHDKISATQYMGILNARLAATAKYSKDWLAIHQQIVAEQDKEQQQAQQQYDSFAQPFQQQTDVVGAFGSGNGNNGISADNIRGFFANAIDSAKKFATVIEQLKSMGFDPGLVEEIARAGPKALPFAQALLTIPVKEVNDDQRQLGLMGEGFGAAQVKSFGTTDASTHMQIGAITVNIGGPGSGAMNPAQVQQMITTGVTQAFAQASRELQQRKWGS